ncbi:MAG: T9SS type A sorting domain-containing protein [Bacteroidetes bacterium]|nr:T9SS type A sorting domain-containing protein [Bacteroidota bacterium]MBS1943466.1 T9SS type A sorting domain-containing protein [Bacteroidota bacterium]
MAISLAASFFCTAFNNSAQAEVVVHSSNGYDVHISVVPIAIIPNTYSCPWGYTYRVQLSYTVTFTGPGAPASLWVLQGTVGCGSTSQFFNLPNSPSSGTVNSAAAWRSVSDCATATVASLDCTDVNVEISGPGIPYQIITIPGSTLPITLVDFSAMPDNGQVRLDWATASEQDNAYFTVERSADAATFAPVLQQPGAVNSSSMLYYSALDGSPLPGLSYYRLRQTDINGTTSYSPVVVVDNHGAAAGALAISPNPSSGETIQLPASAVGKTVQIRSMTGQLLYTVQFTGSVLQCPPIGTGIFLLQATDPVSGRSEQCLMVRR